MNGFQINNDSHPNIFFIYTSIKFSVEKFVLRNIVR